MLIHNAVITGSLTYNGVDISDITGSEASISALNSFSASMLNYTASNNLSSASFSTRVVNLESTASVLTTASASFAIVSQSYASASGSLSTRVTNTETTASSLVTASGSFSTRVTNLELTGSSLVAASASFSTRVVSLESTASVLTTASASFAQQSGSNSTRLTNLESTASVLTTASASFAVVSSSYASASGSLSTRVTTIEGSYATTGSNVFVGNQGITSLSNAISFTSTGSLYTDGGLRITKDMYVSGTAFFNNVTIYGTQSVNYITSSQLNIGTNIITVNTDTPTVRYGGIAVYDSGSTGLTGSLLWDSEQNHWIYTNPSGSTYSGGMMISGPRASARGCEVGTTSCALMMGQGGDHITSSAIFSYGNATCFYGNSYISSSGLACFASTVCAPTFVGGGGDFRVHSNGSVSIGNSTQIGTLYIAGDTTIQTNADIGSNGGYMTLQKNGGNVGIGVATPYANLHVTGTIKVATGNAQGILGLGEANGATVNVGLWRGAANAPTTDGNFLNLGGYEGIIFAVGSAAIGSQTERMRITSGGDVGIGVSSPIYGKLHVGAATTDTVNYYGSSRVLIQQTCNLVNNFANLSFVSQGGSDSAAIWSQIIAHGNGATCGTLSFGTSNSSGAATERMRIASTGEACFACQVCAPSFVGGTISGTTIYGSTTVCGATICTSGNSYTANASIVGGCVGIGGTFNPTNPLHIYGDSNTCFAAMKVQNASACCLASVGIEFQLLTDYVDYKKAEIRAVAASQYANEIDLAFWSGGSTIAKHVERMRLLSTGNLQLTGDPYIYSNSTAAGTTIQAGLRLDSTNKEIKFFTNDLGRVLVDTNGIACFACQVCAKQYLATFAADGDNMATFINSASSYLYGAGGVFIGSSTAHNCTNLAGGSGALIIRNGSTTYTSAIAYNGQAYFCNSVGIGTASPTATLDIGSAKTLSGTDPISVYTDVRVQSAVTGGLIGYNLRMVGLSPAVGSYTIANMYGLKTNTPVVQPNVTVTNSYGVYIGRTDDPSSGGVVTNKYALVTEAAAGNVGIGTTPTYFLDVAAGTNGNFATPAARISTSTGGAGGATILQINHTANSVSGLQIAQYGATPGNGATIYNTENSYLAFGTNNTERMRITSTGIACFACTVCAPLIDVQSARTDSLTLLKLGTNNASSANGDKVNIDFFSCGSLLNGRISRVIEDFTTYAGGLTFSTGITSLTDRLRITSTGIACFACQVCTGAGLISNTLSVSCTLGDDRAMYMSLNCSANYNSGANNTIARSVNSLKFLWYNNCWEIGATRGDDTAIQALVFAKQGNTYLAMTCHGIACFACQVCALNGFYTGDNAYLLKSSLRLRSSDNANYLDIQSTSTCNIISSNYGTADTPIILGTYTGYQCNQLFLATNCRVGIRTNSPAHTLDVSGGIRGGTLIASNATETYWCVGRITDAKTDCWYPIFGWGGIYDGAFAIIQLGYEDNNGDGANIHALWMTTGAAYSTGFSTSLIGGAGNLCTRRNGQCIEALVTGVTCRASNAFIGFTVQSMNLAV